MKVTPLSITLQSDDTICKIWKLPWRIVSWQLKEKSWQSIQVAGVTFCPHMWFVPPLPLSTDRLQSVDLPIELIIGCQLPSIKSSTALGVKRKDRMIYSQPCTLGQLFISQTFLSQMRPVHFDEDCLSPHQFSSQSCHCSSGTLSLSEICVHRDSACNPATETVYLLLSSSRSYISWSQHVFLYGKRNEKRVLW